MLSVLASSMFGPSPISQRHDLPKHRFSIFNGHEPPSKRGFANLELQTRMTQIMETNRLLLYCPNYTLTTSHPRLPLPTWIISHPLPCLPLTIPSCEESSVGVRWPWRSSGPRRGAWRPWTPRCWGETRRGSSFRTRWRMNMVVVGCLMYISGCRKSQKLRVWAFSCI